MDAPRRTANTAPGTRLALTCTAAVATPMDAAEPQGPAPGSPEGATPSNRLDVTLGTAEAKQSLRFIATALRKDNVILVSQVGVPSEAAEAGVVPGLRVLGLSDPMRDDMWMLDGNVSISKIKQSLQMQRSPRVRFIFEKSDEIDELVATASASLDASLDASTDEEDEYTGPRDVADVLMSKAGSSASGKRVAARKASIAQDEQRSDFGVFAGLAALFVVPALLVLLWAYSQGMLVVNRSYFDTMWMHAPWPLGL
ncbi:unnamed protein product [Pedinophyceae sp. YPF-701]|nr:unnamed protein product [Pedinophyceae sp. YPF-701]